MDDLELNDVCTLLIKSTKEEEWRKEPRLFQKHATAPTTLDRLHYLRKLRNKYAHWRPNQHLDSKEQLSDLIIIQKIVQTLAELSSINVVDLENELEKHISELIVQVAQVTDPERFDTQGESKVLSESDHRKLSDNFREIVRDALTDFRVFQKEFTNQDEESAKELNSLFLQQKLTKIEKRLAPLTSIKGRIDGVEKSIVSSLSVLNTEFSDSFEELLNGMQALIDASEDCQNVQARSDDFNLVENPSGNALSNSEISCDDESEDDDIADQNEDGDNGLEDRISESELAEVIELALKAALPLTPWQARDELISLRKRIWEETDSGPSYDGLLRKSMIDEFLQYLPQSEDEAWERMRWRLETVAEEQLPYLSDACSILKRVKKAARS